MIELYSFKFHSVSISTHRWNPAQVRDIPFKFHSVSISTRLLSLLRHLAVNFKFHSVSISTRAETAGIISFFALNSTLFLYLLGGGCRSGLAVIL